MQLKTSMYLLLRPARVERAQWIAAAAQRGMTISEFAQWSMNVSIAMLDVRNKIETPTQDNTILERGRGEEVNVEALLK